MTSEVAIVGVGSSPATRDGDVKVEPLTVTACKRAMDDAGLAGGDIDGMFQYTFGFDSPDATKHAEYCGIAFQLTNILRDLKEDVSMGRVYIPAEDLWAFNYGADELAQGVCDERYRNMMRFEVGRARDFYRAAVPLVPLIHKSGRPGLCAMIDIYSSILDQIESNNYDVFAKHILLSKPRKIAIAAKALIKPKVEGAGPSPTESQS